MQQPNRINQDMLITLKPGAIMPRYHSADASGLDLHMLAWQRRDDGDPSNWRTDRLLLDPGDRVRISTGVSMQIPQGCEGQIRPRSGLTWNHGAIVMLGTIDADYRGDIGVVIIHAGHDGAHTNHWSDDDLSDTIADLELGALVAPELVATERGENGFGSSGVGLAAAPGTPASLEERAFQKLLRPQREPRSLSRTT